MNWVDLIIIAVFVFYFTEGIRRGFIEQTLELIGFFITIFFAIWTYHALGDWIVEKTGIQEVAADPIAFFVMWFAFQLLYSLGLRVFYPLVPAKLRQALPNRLAGLVPAFLKGMVILAVILTVVVTLPVPVKLKAEVNGSTLGSRFVAHSATVEFYINKVLGRDLKETLTFITVPAQTEEIVAPDERVELKFATTEVTIDAKSEAKMLSLINQERARAGLSPLVMNDTITAVARTHSKDMFARGYFAHQNPDGLSPFDRMEAGGVVYSSAGENIAYAPSVELAHSGLMRSPGHRANILGADYRRVGIGIIDGGIYGKMFTQNFAD